MCGNRLAVKPRKPPYTGYFCGCMYNGCKEFTVMPTKQCDPVTATAATSEKYHRTIVPHSSLLCRGLLPQSDEWPPNAVSASAVERDIMGVEFVVRDKINGVDNFGGGAAIYMDQ